MPGEVCHFGAPFQIQSRLVLLSEGRINSPLFDFRLQRAASAEITSQHTHCPLFSIVKDSLWLCSMLITQKSAPNNFCLTTAIFWSVIDRVFQNTFYITFFFPLVRSQWIASDKGDFLPQMQHLASLALNWFLQLHGKYTSQLFTTLLRILGIHSSQSHQ